MCVFVMVFSLGINHAEPNCHGYKTWLKVSLGFYLVDLVIAMNQLMAVKKLRHESLVLIIAMYILLVINTSWYIYGNVIYYKWKDECGLDPGAPAPELTSALWIMVLIGYATMCKCCCITALLAYLVPILVQVYRGHSNQGIKGLMKKLQKGKIKLSELDPEGTKQCAICFEDYAEGDEVITLPCDTRHVYHS